MFFWSLLACVGSPGARNADDDARARGVAHIDDSSAFRLDGAHATVKCSECHGLSEPDWSVPATCVGCHAEDVPAVHVHARGCAGCHTTEAWYEVEAERRQDSGATEDSG